MVTKMTSFRPKHVIVITFDNVTGITNSEHKNTFQLILAYNNAKTYGILIYDNLNTQDALVGWSAPGCSWKLITSLGNSISMMSTSNVVEMGKHVFELHNKDGGLKCQNFKGIKKYYFVYRYQQTSV